MPVSKSTASRSSPLIRRDTDYAFRAMLYLSCHPGAPVSARELAAAQGVPADFVRKILRQLAGAGLVTTRPGPGGGFLLGSRGAKGISMLDVVTAVQGAPRLNRCLADPGACDRQETCPVNERLRTLQVQVEEFLGRSSLADIASAPAGTRRRRHARS